VIYRSGEEAVAVVTSRERVVSERRQQRRGVGEKYLAATNATSDHVEHLDHSELG
jgi:hypothetical protein